ESMTANVRANSGDVQRFSAMTMTTMTPKRADADHANHAEQAGGFGQGGHVIDAQRAVVEGPALVGRDAVVVAEHQAIDGGDGAGVAVADDDLRQIALPQRKGVM